MTATGLINRIGRLLETVNIKLGSVASHIVGKSDRAILERLADGSGNTEQLAGLFPTAAHAASWAGLRPGNSESASKRFPGKTRKGDRYLRRILIQSAWAAIVSINSIPRELPGAGSRLERIGVQIEVKAQRGQGR